MITLSKFKSKRRGMTIPEFNQEFGFSIDPDQYKEPEDVTVLAYVDGLMIIYHQGTGIYEMDLEGMSYFSEDLGYLEEKLYQFYQMYWEE